MRRGHAERVLRRRPLAWRHDGVSAKKLIRINAVEFIGRFLQHVLPMGFKRIRHYGLLAPAHKHKRLSAARTALAMPPLQPAAQEAAAEFMRRVARIDIECCPHCRARWMPVQTAPANRAALRAVPPASTRQLQPLQGSMPQGP